jgi:hypothetical protein
MRTTGTRKPGLEVRPVMKRICLCNLLAMLVLTTGCAAKAPLPAWQHRLTQYITREGNGDPNILSDTTDLHSRRSLRPARITFGELDIPGRGIWPFVARRDANGVLLGRCRVGSHDWLVFLVGVIKRRANHTAGLEDIRLLAFTIDQRGLCWRVAQDSPQALAQYLGALRSNDPDADSGYLSHITFPEATDEFSLAVSGDVVTATERTSGAEWTLRLQVETIAGIHGTRTGS